LKRRKIVNPHRLTLHLTTICIVLFSINTVTAQKQRRPPGGRIAIVVDERLSALRVTPELTGKLVRRVGRGKLVAIRSVKTGSDGIAFYLVNVNSRTHGWIQRESVVFVSRSGDDQRLLSLLKVATDFDRIVKARIFLDYFPLSPLRPEVLLLLGDAAEEAAVKLSRDAERKFDASLTAPASSYFLNYIGLDRYNRQHVIFTFDEKSRRLRYDGAAWREVLRRFPRSPQAVEAQKRFALRSDSPAEVKTN
jgi:hypothetical protein